MCTYWAATHCSGSTDQTGPNGPGTPALLTMMLTGPSSFSVVETTRSTSAGLVTSPVDGDGATADPADVLHGGLQFGKRTRGDRHRRAFAGETHRDGAAEAPSPARHDGDPALEQYLP